MTGRDESFLSEDALDEEDESASADWPDGKRISRWGHKVADGAKDAGEKVADGARSAAHKTKETAQHAHGSAKNWWDRGPPSESEDYDEEDSQDYEEGSSDYDWDEDEEDSEVCTPSYH